MIWIILGIIGGLLLLIAVLLCFSVTANIEYGGQNQTNDFYVKVKYLFITLYNSKKKSKNKSAKQGKKSKNKSAKQEKKSKKGLKQRKKTAKQSGKSFAAKVKEDSGIDEIAADIKKSNSSNFDFTMFKLIYDSAKTPVKRLVRRLRIVNLKINCVIGGEDAAKTALTYGMQSAAVSGFLAWLNEILTLKVKEVSVTADFERDKTDLHMKCKIKLRVISALVCVAGYALNTLKQKQ